MSPPREPVAEAIRRHAARRMSRRQLELTYGREMVIRVLGDEGDSLAPPAPSRESSERSARETSIPSDRAVPFRRRLEICRISKGHNHSRAGAAIGCLPVEVHRYEDGVHIPAKWSRIAALAEYMGEPAGALSLELGDLLERRKHAVAA